MRKLAAILAADVVGFSRLMGADETGTLRRLGRARADIIDPLIAAHHGRIFKVMGDGLLVEFPSAVLGLGCAVEIQNRLDAVNAERVPEERIVLRIGLHQGDVVVEGSDLLGDGVNVAARLEPMAEPGGICISDRVREDATGKLMLEMEDLGEPALKNIRQKIRVHRVVLQMRTRHPPRPPTAGAPSPVQVGRPTLAVLPFESLGQPSAADAHFADGLLEDVVIALSHLRFLSVAPRTAVIGLSEPRGDMRRIGQVLGVRYLVTGAIRQAGDRVRVTAQLIEAASGEHLWADRHEGVLTDVFETLDRIAQLIATAVTDCLDDGTRRPAARDTGHDVQTVVLRGDMQHTLSLESSDPPRQVTLGTTPLTIGRVPPSQLVLTGGEVSRAHCRVVLAGDEAVLTDLSSTNGTFVDDHRITDPVVLQPGARVRVGTHVLLYDRKVADRTRPMPRHERRAPGLPGSPDSTVQRQG